MRQVTRTRRPRKGIPVIEAVEETILHLERKNGSLTE
jgi:hypothetical protein